LLSLEERCWRLFSTHHRMQSGLLKYISGICQCNPTTCLQAFCSQQQQQQTKFRTLWAEWGQNFPNTSHASSIASAVCKNTTSGGSGGACVCRAESLQRQIDFVLEASRELAPNLKPAQMVLSASGHLCQNLGDKILMDKENAQ
jgi:hypothetical protein